MRRVIPLVAALVILTSCASEGVEEPASSNADAVMQEAVASAPQSSEAATQDAASDASAPDTTAAGTTPEETEVAVAPESVDRAYEGDEYPEALAHFVQTAIADLAARLGAEPAEIRVVSVEEVVWPNHAMGCEQPGMAYAQVPVDGLRIVLAHGGIEYVYHSGGSIEPFLCIPNLVKEPVPPQIDITGGSVTTVPGAATEEKAPVEQPGGPGDPDV